MSACFCGDEDNEEKASDGRSARSWVKSYSGTAGPLVGAADLTGNSGESSISMGESETPGEGGACGAGRVDFDGLPGRDIVLTPFEAGGFCASFVAVGFAHIAPLGFQGGECSCGGCV